MSGSFEKWGLDLAAARHLWEAEHTPEAFEGYVVWCAGYLCAPEVLSTHKHWFCSDAETRETALNSLPIFSFVAPEAAPASDSYVRYENAFNHLVFSCAACAKGYQQCRDELILRLLANGPFDQKQVLDFVKELNHKDRARLSQQITNHPDSIPTLTEILWSPTCVKTHGFISKHLIETGFLTEHSQKINEVGACPGFMPLAFSHKHRVRKVVLKQIMDLAAGYEQAWHDFPQMFKYLFVQGLKSYSRARVHADLAWYTAGQLVRGLSAPGMVDAGLSELAQEQLGEPRFGAHFFLKHLLALCRRKKLSPKFSEIQKAAKYVCAHTSRPLITGMVDKDASQAAQMSESYRKLDARVIIDWVKLYAQWEAELVPADLIQPLAWLLELPRAAYESIEFYIYAVQASLKIVTEHLDRNLFLSLDKSAERIVLSISRCPPDIIWVLWQYQIDHRDSFLSLWSRIVKAPQLVQHASSSTYNGYIVGLLQGSRDIPLLYRTPRIDGAAPEPTRAENVLQELFETLTDETESEQLIQILKDPQVLYSTLFSAISGNRGLALAAEEFLKAATSSESLEAALLELVKPWAPQVLDVLDSLLSEANKSIGDWFSVLSGLLRLSSEALEQIYAPQSGIDTTNEKLKRKLTTMWPSSWTLVRLVLSNIRLWAREYGNSQAKPVIAKILEFSKSMLSKFRLLEADMASGSEETTQTDKHWGSVLSHPVMDCVPAMSDLLQLSMPEMLSIAHEIIIEMLELMKSFKVPLTNELFTLFKNLGNHSKNSKLTEEQLRELLSATGLLTDDQITEVMNAPRELPKAHSMPNSQTSGHSSPLQQRAISDFFRPGSGQPNPPPRTIVNNQVVPAAPAKASNMAMLREQLSTKSQPPQPLNRQALTIHPERPPGFNQRKPALPEDSDGSDDDEAGGALDMLAAKRREDAAAKLREAYHNRPRTSLMTSPATEERLAREARELSNRRMKARLNVEPTELHRVMLQWDYFDVSPPFKADASVPDVFVDVKHYEKVMSPLLFLEAWEQIQNAKVDSDGKAGKVFPITIGKRVKVDGFTDAYVSVLKSHFADSGVSESDLILLGREGSDDRTTRITQDMPHCFARLREGTIRYSGSKKNQYVDLQIRMNDRNGFLTDLVQGTVVSAQVVGNVRTVEREFSALKALPYYDLADAIIKAQPTASRADASEIFKLQRSLGLNSSQAESVAGALSHSGFSLIQGPPGTGKTKTILGIIGSYFTRNQMSAQASGTTAVADKRILVCAPSNAAVDEIVLRLKGGVVNSAGTLMELNVTRLGRLEAMSEQIRDLSLEEKVNRAVSDAAEPADEELRRSHTALTQQRDALRKKLASTESSLSESDVVKLRSEITQINGKIREKNYALDTQRERLELAKKQRDVKFRKEQHDILSKSQVVCTTLSASAHPLLSTLGIAFPTVIIDEAAQSIELSALIPLKYGCTQCIMVGDPNQLPPTVISREASRLKYEQSLFVRMFNQHHNIPGMVSMLDTQFRMHPEISRFPSKEFYDNRLKDGEGLSEQRRRSWHSKYPALGPYTFFEVKGKHERSNGRSLRNTAEARAALALVKFLRREFPEVGSIGVISPYREQVRFMKQIFTESLGSEITAHVDFNSIDGFQGQEKDVIVMSCVRATSGQTDSVGFLGDVRRMNVAVTRAKSSLWILGNSDSLVGNEVWRELIRDATERGCFYNADPNNFISVVTRSKRVMNAPNADPRPESFQASNQQQTENWSSTDQSTGQPSFSDSRKRKAVHPYHERDQVASNGSKRVLSDCERSSNTETRSKTGSKPQIRHGTATESNAGASAGTNDGSARALETSETPTLDHEGRSNISVPLHGKPPGDANAPSGAHRMPFHDAHIGQGPRPPKPSASAPPARGNHKQKNPASVFIKPRRGFKDHRGRA